MDGRLLHEIVARLVLDTGGAPDIRSLVNRSISTREMFHFPLPLPLPLPSPAPHPCFPLASLRPSSARPVHQRSEVRQAAHGSRQGSSRVQRPRAGSARRPLRSSGRSSDSAPGSGRLRPRKLSTDRFEAASPTFGVSTQACPELRREQWCRRDGLATEVWYLAIHPQARRLLVRTKLKTSRKQRGLGLANVFSSMNWGGGQFGKSGGQLGPSGTKRSG